MNKGEEGIKIIPDIGWGGWSVFCQSWWHLAMQFTETIHQVKFNYLYSALWIAKQYVNI